MSRKIFIAGEHGQLARALVKAYLARGDTVIALGRSRINITDLATLRSVMSRFNPDIVINTAAYTAVDDAENNVDTAYRVNCEGAKNVAISAKETSALLIHISTDYVFDGLKPTPYIENDLARPLCTYGRSKFAGEQAVAAEAGDYIILRTGWLSSETGNNFVKSMLALANTKNEIFVVNDQRGTPTFAFDLADAIANIAEKTLAARNRSSLLGLYHAAGPALTSRFEFAQAIMECSKAKGGPSCHVRPIATEQYPTRAVRPVNSGLDCSRLLQAFGIALPAWYLSLNHCLDEILRWRPEGTQ